MSITENFATVKKTIARLAASHYRQAESIRLVAVTKRQSADAIEQALATGHRCFGENRVQEAQEHWDYLKPRYPELELHMIGPLQTNKAKDAVALFDVIETLDRERLALVLAEEMQAQRKSLPCFIQVNTGEEAQKSGVLPQHLPEFFEFCTRNCGLNITGLMCIPPLAEPPATHFSMLQKMARDHDLPHLSMGMSDDYQKAISWGATHVRLGSTLFGAREE